MLRRGLARLPSVVVAGVVAHAVQSRLAASPPGGRQLWTRHNHAGGEVTLLEGPAAVAGLLAGTALTPGLDRRRRAVAMTALAGIGAVGAYDDLWGSTGDKGLRGHLAALRRGEVTSGIVKVGVIGAAGLLASGIRPDGQDQRRSVRLTRHLLDGALVAGTANLVNLLDLRPGRALKVAGGFTPLGLVTPAGAGLAAPVAGVVAGTAREDLAARSMLGDCGANTLGAAGGMALVGAAAPWVRTTALAAVAGLTLASEKVSFSEVIEANPVLSALDRWGRTRVSSAHLAPDPSAA